MSQRDFAAHLGVSERMVAKWESGGDKINPRPVNQSALDTSLACAPPDVRARFEEHINLVHAKPESGTAEDYSGASPLTLAGRQVRHPIDGKLMTLVEGGEFLRGDANESIFAPAFYIDVFPATNADYARFVAATGHRAPQHWSQGDGPPGHLLNHPVVFVTWHDATAYASWAAKCLPSSEQWEKAARGERGDTYPWGSQLTAAKCNVRESEIRATTPVDRYHSGASPYGVYDMCGNAWEWLSARSAPGRYELKGSAFTSPFARATPSLFNDASADMLDDDTGFRCVSPAETMRALLTMNS